MSLFGKLFTGLVLLLTLGAIVAVLALLAIDRLTDRPVVMRTWQVPITTTAPTHARLDISTGDVSVGGALPAAAPIDPQLLAQGETVMSDNAHIATRFQTAGDGGRLDLSASDRTFVPGWLDWARSSGSQSWDVALNPAVVRSVEMHVDRGSVRLDLSELPVSGFTIRVGVGDVDLTVGDQADLSATGTVQVGIGRTTIHLPDDLPVNVEYAGGGESVQTDGDVVTTPDGFVNGAWQHRQPSATTGAQVVISLDMGVGDLALVTTRRTGSPPDQPAATPAAPTPAASPITSSPLPLGNGGMAHDVDSVRADRRRSIASA